MEKEAEETREGRREGEGTRLKTRLTFQYTAPTERTENITACVKEFYF
jgi:hypothetical protein